MIENVNILHEPYSPYSFSPCGNRAVCPLLTIHICNKTVPCYLPITYDINGSFEWWHNRKLPP